MLPLRVHPSITYWTKARDMLTEETAAATVHCGPRKEAAAVHIYELPISLQGIRLLRLDVPLYVTY